MWKLLFVMISLPCWSQVQTQYVNLNSDTVATVPPAPAAISSSNVANFNCLNKRVGSCSGSLTTISPGTAQVSADITATAPLQRVDAASGNLVTKQNAEATITSKNTTLTTRENLSNTNVVPGSDDPNAVLTAPSGFFAPATQQVSGGY